MSKSIIYIALSIEIINLLVGLIVSSYQWANVVFTSLAVCITTYLMLVSCQGGMKDGFKPALLLTFMIVGAIQFILLAIMPLTITDNWYLIASLGLLAFEVIVLILSKQLSSKIR